MAAFPREYRQSIDGLRGLAALYVVLVHFEQNTWLPFHFEWLQDFVDQFGALAVRIFFTLSGIIVSASMQERLGVERSHWRNFYLRRAFRILPLWWLVLAIFVFRGMSPGLAVFDAFFLFGFGRYELVYFDIAAWSLASELIFYAAFPLIRRYLWEPITLLALSVAFTAVAQFWVLGWKSVPHFWFYPIGHLQFFLIGVLLYQAVSVPALRKILLSKVSQSAWVELLIGASLAALVALHGLKFPIQDELLIPPLVLAAFRARGWVAAFARMPLWRHCGRYCYFIYICHLPVAFWISPLREVYFKLTGLGGVAGEYQILSWYPVFCVLLVSLATASERFFERPARILGEALIDRLDRKRKRSDHASEKRAA